MSRPVELADVATRITEYGPLAALVTTGDAGTPHVVSVAVTVLDHHLAVRVGARSAANIAARPNVTLLWMRDGLDYHLILDGVASSDGDDRDLHEVSITVQRGILHRVAGRSDAGPTCVPLDAPHG